MKDLGVLLFFLTFSFKSDLLGEQSEELSRELSVQLEELEIFIT
jgi:hypothetical protein